MYRMGERAKFNRVIEVLDETSSLAKKAEGEARAVQALLAQLNSRIGQLDGQVAQLAARVTQLENRP